MTTVNDVPPQKLIDLTAEKLREYPEIAAPEWANEIKTGTHVEVW